MSVQGLSHITFIVKDIERMTHFLCQGLGAEEIYDSKARNFSLSHEKFFLLGGVWLAVMAGTPSTERTYRHTAFKIADGEVAGYKARLESIGVEILPPRSRIEGEGESIYFYDFDDHLFELHTGTLEQRLASYLFAV
ncbi:MAG: FosX/FosE/FosI family fosfomycin resistance hydrolase [Iodobacter sp.]